MDPHLLSEVLSEVLSVSLAKSSLLQPVPVPLPACSLACFPMVILGSLTDFQVKTNVLGSFQFTWTGTYYVALVNLELAM